MVNLAQSCGGQMKKKDQNMTSNVLYVYIYTYSCCRHQHLDIFMQDTYYPYRALDFQVCFSQHDYLNCFGFF